LRFLPELSHVSTLKAVLDIQRKDELNAVFTAMSEDKLSELNWDYRQLYVAVLLGFESLATRA